MPTSQRVGNTALLALALLLAGGGTTQAATVSLIENGDFEEGGGGLGGWTVVDQPGSDGSFLLQSGTTSPINGFDVPEPPGPTHAAMTDQGAAGSHLLYQDFVVPLGVTSASLSFDLYVANQAPDFFTPDSLDFTILDTINQQARVDITTTSADPFSVASGDVLENLFRTNAGDPLVSGYTTLTADLTSLLSAHAGETLRLRFAEADNLLPFQFGVDRVGLTANVVPEPASLTALSLGVLCVLGHGWLRRKVAAVRSRSARED